MTGQLLKASPTDTLAVITEVVAPTLCKGVLRRRPKLVALAERFHFDDRAVRRMQALRRAYGAGPLLVSLPRHSQALILATEDMHRVLDGTPDPFSSNTMLKHAALAHFEAKVSLVSSSSQRDERRAFNDSMLESGHAIHSMFDRFVPAIEDEIKTMLSNADADGALDWPTFDRAWYRLVRRILLGRPARDDDRLTDMLAMLRSRANWVFLLPRRRRLEQQFRHRLENYLDKAEAGSLAERVPSERRLDTAPTDQIAHWLFASDAAGINIFRTLALISTHPDVAERARDEVTAAAQDNRLDLPFLRACVLDAARLWPTTPMILRETTQEVAWRDGTMSKGTQVLIYTPFFHRDDERLLDAHRFAPEIWLDPDPARRYPFVPFSDGPAICPAHHFVPELSSLVIAAILKRRDPRLISRGDLDPKLRLPGTLSPYALRFSLKGRHLRNVGMMPGASQFR